MFVSSKCARLKGVEKIQDFFDGYYIHAVSIYIHVSDVHDCVYMLRGIIIVMHSVAAHLDVNNNFLAVEHEHLQDIELIEHKTHLSGVRTQ